MDRKNIIAVFLVMLPTLLLAQPLGPNPVERDPSMYCRQCWERRNQKDYYANEFNCSTYFHCFKNGSQIEGILRPCPTNHRFDEFILACVPMVFPGQCNDPCKNPTTMMEGWWMDPQQCGIFYQCSNFYSIKMCCPPNHSFNITWGDCMYDGNCTSHNDECGKRSITVPMWTPQIDGDRCHDLQYDVVRKADPEDPAKYYVILTPYKDTEKNISMKCPLGTNFDFMTCKCSIHANLTMPEKFIDCFLHVEAEDVKMKILDTSFSKFIVDNKGTPKVPMTSGPNAATNSKVIDCPGNSHLEVPGIQTNLMKQLTITLWTRWDCNEPSNGSLISLRAEKLLFVLIKSVVLVKKGPTRIECITETFQSEIIVGGDVACDEWQFLAFTYNGFDLKFYVNGVLVQEKPDEGDGLGLMINCPLSICEDAVHGAYKGQLDDFELCREVFDAGEILAMYNEQLPRFQP